MNDLQDLSVSVCWWKAFVHPIFNNDHSTDHTITETYFTNIDSSIDLFLAPNLYSVDESIDLCVIAVTIASDSLIEAITRKRSQRSMTKRGIECGVISFFFLFLFLFSDWGFPLMLFLFWLFAIHSLSHRLFWNPFRTLTRLFSLLFSIFVILPLDLCFFARFFFSY
eukprot:TRINITY_DN10042_c0_g1_i1.p1 TRINITY_DN10042_c0_g1~~TRINITY_DN10042_c0_g1_i1.p1  ORF type:complete len:167 (+),score=10.58 TRINITY_DN10042_c0_g1_i1:903-1403(+)